MKMTYKVTINKGLDWTRSYTVEAINEQEALDKVADHLEEMSAEGLYANADHYELADLCEVEQTVDEYAAANGLVCCGKHGIYVQLINIEEV